MAKYYHNGTNIIAKHDTIFQGEEILEFLMAPKKKKKPPYCPGAEDSNLLTWSQKVQLASLTGSNRGQHC
jgi:hypothetical protein